MHLRPVCWALAALLLLAAALPAAASVGPGRSLRVQASDDSAPPASVPYSGGVDYSSESELDALGPRPWSLVCIVVQHLLSEHAHGRSAACPLARRSGRPRPTCMLSYPRHLAQIRGIMQTMPPYVTPGPPPIYLRMLELTVCVTATEQPS